MKTVKRLTSDGRITAGIRLLQALTTAPDRTLSIQDACEALLLGPEQLASVVDVLSTLSDRLSGTRLVLMQEHDTLRLEGDAAQLLPLRLDVAESMALSHVLRALSIDEACAERLREGLLLIDAPSEAGEIADLEQFGPWYQQLSEAIEDGVRCQIRYRSSTDAAPHARTIDPLSLEIGQDGTAYLVAWNVAKNAERRYRLDRIQAVSLTELSVTRHERAHATVEDSLRAGGRDVTLAVYDERLLASLSWAGITAVDAAHDSPAIVHVLCTSHAWLFERVLASGGDLEIISPHELRAEFVTWVRGLATA